MDEKYYRVSANTSPGISIWLNLQESKSFPVSHPIASL